MLPLPRFGCRGEDYSLSPLSLFSVPRCLAQVTSFDTSGVYFQISRGVVSAVLASSFSKVGDALASYDSFRSHY